MAQNDYEREQWDEATADSYNPRQTGMLRLSKKNGKRKRGGHANRGIARVRADRPRRQAGGGLGAPPVIPPPLGMALGMASLGMPMTGMPAGAPRPPVGPPVGSPGMPMGGLPPGMAPPPGAPPGIGSPGMPMQGMVGSSSAGMPPGMGSPRRRGFHQAFLALPRRRKAGRPECRCGLCRQICRRSRFRRRPAWHGAGWAGERPRQTDRRRAAEHAEERVSLCPAKELAQKALVPEVIQLKTKTTRGLRFPWSHNMAPRARRPQSGAKFMRNSRRSDKADGCL